MNRELRRRHLALWIFVALAAATVFVTALLALRDPGGGP